jgi:hypothetical protein
MRRTDLDDTNIEIHRLMIKLLREKGPQWRIMKAFELSEELKQFVQRARKSVEKSRGQSGP